MIIARLLLPKAGGLKANIDQAVHSRLISGHRVPWTKPILLLVDELSGSGGDAFPMLMKENHLAKLFGQTTMGLGGNVDSNAIVLPESRSTINVTRGLYVMYRPDGA